MDAVIERVLEQARSDSQMLRERGAPEKIMMYWNPDDLVVELSVPSPNTASGVARTVVMNVFAPVRTRN